MNKYIIELGEDANMVQVISVTQSGNAYIDSTVYVGYLEQLNSDYINKHFGSLQDDAYQKGFEDGVTKRTDGDACTGCKYKGNPNDNPCKCCSNGYPNQWTAKDDKIKVGDEVEPFYTDITGVVTLIDGDTIYVLWRDGSSTSTLKLKEVTKTGRHFDIKSILEAMKA